MMMLPTEEQKQDPPEATRNQADVSAMPKVCWMKPDECLQAGQPCPRCQEGIIDYNSMLHLICPKCGLTEAGTCT